jgi:hypothetical protein
MGVTKTPPQKHDEELKKLETLIQRLNNKRNEAAHEYNRRNHKQNAKLLIGRKQAGNRRSNKEINRDRRQ